jgi:hypothetical protein
MAKTDVLMMRIEGATKERIKKAADHAGQTMSTFVGLALMERADRVLARKRGLLPTYFKALAARAATGGQGSWKAVGHDFAQGCVPDLMADIGDAEGAKEIRRLERIADKRAPSLPNGDDLAEILAWFDEHFPRCMELVPARRRTAFAAGVADRARHEGIDL